MSVQRWYTPTGQPVSRKKEIVLRVRAAGYKVREAAKAANVHLHTAKQWIAEAGLYMGRLDKPPASPVQAANRQKSEAAGDPPCQSEGGLSSPSPIISDPPQTGVKSNVAREEYEAVQRAVELREEARLAQRLGQREVEAARGVAERPSAAPDFQYLGDRGQNVVEVAATNALPANGHDWWPDTPHGIPTGDLRFPDSVRRVFRKIY